MSATLADAMSNVAELIELPHLRTPGEDDGFWTVYRVTAGTRCPTPISPR
jgi:hypothetical protein